MKITLLIESSKETFRKMVGIASKKPTNVIDTTGYGTEKEWNFILKKVNDFHVSSFEILMVRFSGKEVIVKNLGDESSRMVICLSENKESIHYNKDIIDTLKKVLNMFEKERIKI